MGIRPWSNNLPSAEDKGELGVSLTPMAVDPDSLESTRDLSVLLCLSYLEGLDVV